MRKTNQFRKPVISSLLIFLLLSAFPRPATAASTDQGSPPPVVTVVRIADKDITPVTEYVGHVEAIQAVE